MKQMLKARERIDFAMFTFAQSSGIDDAMARLVGDDLPIRGVLFTQIAISADHAFIGQLKRASPNLLRRSRLVCKSQRDRWTQCRHHREL